MNAVTKEYTVIGAGPAGIIAIVRILNKILQSAPKPTQEEAVKLAKNICWIDDSFNVGAFGKQWKNVPGNTAVSQYRWVYKEMIAVLQAYGVANIVPHFALNEEDANNPSLLKVAAEPLRWMTGLLKNLVTVIEGRVDEIISTPLGLTIKMTAEEIVSKRCILAIGGKPRVFPLPAENKEKFIPLETVLDKELLRTFLKDKKVSTVLVQGSSHSAALAAWNLLECGVCVKQIMNKEYAYYSNENGHVRHENTGLKGEVAKFTRCLQNKEIHSESWSYEIIESGSVNDYSHYSHLVLAIGIESANTLTIDGIPSDKIEYSLTDTTTHTRGLFVVGVGYPPAAKDGSRNVGISKFWPDMGESVSVWEKISTTPIDLELID